MISDSMSSAELVCAIYCEIARSVIQTLLSLKGFQGLRQRKEWKKMTRFDELVSESAGFQSQSIKKGSKVSRWKRLSSQVSDVIKKVNFCTLFVILCAHIMLLSWK